MLRVHSHKLGEVAILRLKGRLVIGNVATLRDAVLSQSDASAVVLDFAQVTGIDARGLGLLLELREYTQSKGIEFRLMNVTRLVGQVLEITKLNTVFETCDESEPQPLITHGDQSVEVEVAMASCD
jgi:anti-anti-sigma factor